MPSIFLAHSSQDKKAIRNIHRILSAHGIRVWFDEAELQPGDSLFERISQGLEQVDFVAVFLSRSSVQSEWFKRELAAASSLSIERRRGVVIPVRLPDLEPTAIPALLKDLVRIEHTSDDETAEQLLRAIIRNYTDANAYQIALSDPAFPESGDLSWFSPQMQEWRTRSRTGVTGTFSPLDQEHRILGSTNAPPTTVIDVVTFMENTGNKVWRQASRWVSPGCFEGLIYLREGVHEGMRIVVSIYSPVGSASSLASRRIFSVHV